MWLLFALSMWLKLTIKRCAAATMASTGKMGAGGGGPAWSDFLAEVKESEDGNVGNGHLEGPSWCSYASSSCSDIYLNGFDGFQRHHSRALTAAPPHSGLGGRILRSAPSPRRGTLEKSRRSSRSGLLLSLYLNI